MACCRRRLDTEITPILATKLHRMNDDAVDAINECCYCSTTYITEYTCSPWMVACESYKNDLCHSSESEGRPSKCEKAITITTIPIVITATVLCSAIGFFGGAARDIYISATSCCTAEERDGHATVANLGHK